MVGETSSSTTDEEEEIFVPFTNSGTVRAVAGTSLVFLNSVRFDAGSTIAAVTGSRLGFGGAVLLDAPVTIPPGVTVDLASSLDGDGSLTADGTLNWPAGSQDGTGTTRIRSGGKVSIGATNTQVTLSRTLEVDQGASVELFGQLDGDGDLIVSGRFDWQGGSQVGSGTTRMQSGSSLTISGLGTPRPELGGSRVLRIDAGVNARLLSGSLSLRGTARIDNAGSFTWERAIIGLFDTATIDNSGTFAAIGTRPQIRGGPANAFTNTGSVVMVGETSSSTTDEEEEIFVPFTNSGTVRAVAGTSLVFLNTVRFDAGSTIAAVTGSRLGFGGAVLLDAPVTIPPGVTVDLASSLDGDGSLTADG